MNDNINSDLVKQISLDIKQQYNQYKIKVEELAIRYEKLKRESKDIEKVIEKMKNEAIIDSHLSKLFMLVNGGFKRMNKDNKKNLDKISKYFQEAQVITVESIKTIFEIRKFFTGQTFEIYVENQGKVFSFNIEDIEKYAGDIIPIYTDSLEKMIYNMSKDSRSVAPELNKLGLTLKNAESATELKGIQAYINFVNSHIKKNKMAISENRKLEAAIYLYGRNPDVNFNNKSERHSMHVMLGWYISKGGTKDNITMYKLGDALAKTEQGFKNIEIKMHNGTIALTMIANGINKLKKAFNSEDVESKIIKFFSVNKSQISSPIEREAEKAIIKGIEDIFKKIQE